MTAADTNAVADAEIVTGAGPGVVFGPHVRGFDRNGPGVTTIAGINFYAYGTPRYGVNVSRGDVDGDGMAELLTGAGPSDAFPAAVRGWNVDGGPARAIAALDFNASQRTFGANVAAGDVDGDGYDEIVTASGPSHWLDSLLRVMNYDNDALGWLPGASVTPFASRYGARVGAGDLDLSGRDVVSSGAGPDASADARARPYRYDGSTMVPLTDFLAFDGTYGVNVAIAEQLP